MSPVNMLHISSQISRNKCWKVTVFLQSVVIVRLDSGSESSDNEKANDRKKSDSDFCKVKYAYVTGS